MADAQSSPEMEDLIQEYIQEHDWEQDKAHVQNTSQAVRQLVRALIETGSLNEPAMRTVYNLCQNDEALKPDTKKQRIDDLDIDDDVKSTIKARIEEGTGTVGAGTYTVPIEDYEEAAFEFLSTAVESDDRSEIDAAIETFAALEIEDIQNGIISPLLYFLHPTKYPISNDRSRTEMQQFFDYEMSGRLTSYLDEVERFHEVRSSYSFEENFRHLDSFFMWLNQQDLNYSDADTTPDQALNDYWQDIKQRERNADAFIMDPSRDSFETWLKSCPWTVERFADTKLENILTEHSTDDVADLFQNAADTGSIEPVLKLPGFAMTLASEVLTTLDPDTFLPLNKTSVTALEALDANPPRPATKSVSEYHSFCDNVIDIIDQYHLEQYADAPPAWATDYQLATHVFERHGNGEIDLAELPDGQSETQDDHTTQNINYFWATANPSIWSVDEIADGGTVFYTAHNEKGNKKRLFDAFTTAKPGDRVLFYESTPVKEIVAEGTVTDGLESSSTTTSETPTTADTQSINDTDVDAPQGVRIEFDRHVDGVSWADLNAIPDLEAAAPITNRAQGSLFPLTEAEFETILALEDPVIDDVSQDTIDSLAAKLTAPDVEIAVPESLYFEDGDRLQREIEASLRSGKHIILTGPPGTGKTKLAKAICEAATTYNQVDGYRFTTATSEWTAFDTIGGYIPSTSDGGQELIFEPRLFLKCFRQDRVVNEWLIIDEINRSDIDKAFGQLFSVLSGDSTELPYERDRTVELLSLSATASDEKLADIIRNPDAFPVTPSWRLIATMNTYDKTSLYEMSYAFMRRFNFIHVGVPPIVSDDGIKTSLLDPGREDNYAAAWLADDGSLRPVLENLYPVITVLWQRINEHRVIGPSIVYDIIRYLAAYDDTDDTHRAALTSATVSLVYPQLEGMRPEQQKRLIGSLTDQNVATEHGPVDLNLNRAVLHQKAADFFGISFDDDS